MRTKDPQVRTMLIERAALMLRSREPITLRALVASTGVSMMAVYTYFDGMDGLWKAVRQEGFRRLATRLETVRRTGDPVRELAALSRAYLDNAVENPDLYRVMFDAAFDLEDAAAADAALRRLIDTAARARDRGRFRPGTDPGTLATQAWAIGHGLASLVTTGPLPADALENGAPMLTALFVAAGDDPRKCRKSVKRGWRDRPEQ